MFWFFGYLEVYIFVLLVFGVFFEVLLVFVCKLIFGYKVIAVVIVGIVFFGLFVWVYYMFVMLMLIVVFVFFMLLSFVIVVLMGVKIFNWIVTLWCGMVEWMVLLLYCVGGIFTFMMGGIMGIFLVVFLIDWQLMDIYFVVVYFYYMVFGVLAFVMLVGFYYWFLKMMGWMMSEKFGKVGFGFTFIGFYLMFLI